MYIDLYKDRMHPAELFGKQVLYNEQPIAAKRLAASFYIVPDVLQNMPCPYTGDNPRNVQAKKSVPASSSRQLLYQQYLLQEDYPNNRIEIIDAAFFSTELRMKPARSQA